ncbi:sedoheptulokinase [Frankliniella occidentalis]|uniref:Sedoheptulokinase n=1 Tax=Frankliniella occidentalis TaxID=133901 RepID=A0A6J1S6M9_FRAOC|nr:sedoheptulokinase [Frankliniella occidentalis]XP_052124384.1 sedoheptulokinase [Frankliniella occidentalis]XP_052124385.1 sedoheptulokinase [Frankliniella occidentalis]
MPGDQHLVLGIDIGTTSVKVCLVVAGKTVSAAGGTVEGEGASDCGAVLARQAKDTAADIRTSTPNGHEQNVPKILSTLHNCISRLPRDLLRQVRHIGLSGQMHGVVLWQQAAGQRLVLEELMQPDCPVPMSPLYTWQDSRCSPTFLQDLPQPIAGSVVHSGYGCATLFWLAKHRPDELERFTHAATVQDLVTAMLCGLDRPAMSVQTAASWGYCDAAAATWEVEKLTEAGFPVRLLPAIVHSEQSVGTLTEPWEGIPAGTSVGSALGDFQCSVLGTLHEARDAVLNISTSAQIAFVLPEGFRPDTLDSSSGLSPAVLYFPYFEGRYLAVAASINGGNALATFIRMLQQWTLDLGFHVPQSALWEKAVALGLAVNEDAQAGLATVSPTLLGERHDPSMRAVVSNLDPGNLGLGAVFRALCKGVVSNLHHMMPREVFVRHGVQRIVGGGSALVRNQLLQAEVSTAYQMPVHFTQSGDAAVGAALAATFQHPGLRRSP